MTTQNKSVQLSQCSDVICTIIVLKCCFKGFKIIAVSLMSAINADCSAHSASHFCNTLNALVSYCIISGRLSPSWPQRSLPIKSQQNSESLCFKLAICYAGWTQSVHPSQSFSSYFSAVRMVNETFRIILHFVMTNDLTAPGSGGEFALHNELFAVASLTVQSNNYQCNLFFAGTYRI